MKIDEVKMNITSLTDEELLKLRYQKSKEVATLNNQQMASKILNILGL